MDIPDYLKQPIADIDQKIAEAKQLLADPALVSLAQEEIKQLEAQKLALLDPSNLQPTTYNLQPIC